MGLKQIPPWGPNNTRQPCPCIHIRKDLKRRWIDESGKCAECKTTRSES